MPWQAGLAQFCAASDCMRGTPGLLALTRAHVQLALADALNAQARISTDSNTLVASFSMTNFVNLTRRSDEILKCTLIAHKAQCCFKLSLQTVSIWRRLGAQVRRGTLDLDPARRKVWAALSPEALRHAAAARTVFEGHLKVRSVGLPGAAPPLRGGRPAPPAASGSAAATYALWVLPVYMDAFLFDGSAKVAPLEFVIMGRRPPTAGVLNKHDGHCCVRCPFLGVCRELCPRQCRGLASPSSNSPGESSMRSRGGVNL